MPASMVFMDLFQKIAKKAVTARLIDNTVMGVNSSGRILDPTSEVCGFTVTGALSNAREGGYGNGKLISKFTIRCRKHHLL